ncbi:MAG: aminomethyl-transferring glycine dehydrogenase subunit GcvPB [Pseudomonadota bacterium]
METVPRHLVHPTPLIFEQGSAERTGASLPRCDVPQYDPIQEWGDLGRQEPALLPEVSEVEAVRHYTRLSRLNYAVDLGMYPLGSCTMKYNPKIDEWAARLGGFTALHPYQPDSTVQGALALMSALERALCEITGMARASLQPAAGAHGELTGLMVIRAALKGKGRRATKILVPDSAHGTNPASCTINGFTAVTVKTGESGILDTDAVKRAVDSDTAGIMVTNPSTLGVFEDHIAEIAEVVHSAGGFVYMDGANLNALLGKVRPGDIGVDVLHINLHKTFGTPHGGGGPGAGPIAVVSALEPFLPVPTVETDGDRFWLELARPQSIGRVRSFYGNFGILVRAYAYIREMGAEGLAKVSDHAVLNANYLRARLKDAYVLASERRSMHEVVLSDRRLKKETGVQTMDVAKRLMDFGFHPPTVYFPLIVPGAMMIEPTETEPPESLDELADALLAIAKEAHDDPELVKSAPHGTFVRRPDETRAARQPKLRWQRSKA